MVPRNTVRVVVCTRMDMLCSLYLVYDNDRLDYNNYSDVFPVMVVFFITVQSWYSSYNVNSCCTRRVDMFVCQPTMVL